MSDHLQDTLDQGKSQDPAIRIEELEFDPTRRGYTQIPNYFKYYWTPLIGHKAAAVYEMILSFAHGNKDTCCPSLNRLCAHLGITRVELIGRKRKSCQGRRAKEYHQKGALEVLQDHGLLFIEACGENPHTYSYTFRVLKNPPLLTPAQLSGLSKIIQESHQRLLERCRIDQERLTIQASKRGIANGNRGVLPLATGERGKGIANGNTNRTTTINKTTTTEPTPPTPQGGFVVVSGQLILDDLQSPLSSTLESDASALNQLSAKDPISATPSLSPAGAPAEASPAPTPDPKPSAIALTPGSLFAPYREQLEGLAARHGLEKVADYVDKLDWQYRQKKEPPGKPIALLNKLLREGMITPEGYQTLQEREALRREKARVSQAVWAAEARRREVAETLRQKDAQDQALWETLPEEERALWVRQVAPEVPEVCRSEFLLGMLARAAFLEHRGLHGDPAGEGLTAPRPSDGHPCHNGQANPGSALALS